MFAIYCDGGQWLITENGRGEYEQFVYAACKWQALQIPSKQVAHAILKRVRAHGQSAWLVKVEALRLGDKADKMARNEVQAITALADTLGMRNSYFLAQGREFQAAAWNCLRWILSQDAGGIVMPVFQQEKTTESQRGQTWAGRLFFDLKASQRDYIERTALGLKCQQCAGVAA